MTLKTLASAVALSAVLVSSGAATAQTAPAAQPQLVQGPAIPGVCVFNQAVAVGSSSAGKAMANRLKQLGDAVTAELKPETTALETEEKNLRAAADKNNDAFKQRANTFGQRVQNYQQKVNLRAQELQATEAEQINKIGTAMKPILTTVYQQRKCSVLLDANATLGYSPEMDLTDEVVRQLNTKLASLTFDRKRLDQQAAQAAAKPAATPAKK
ncbi:MAG TPA: OmpH family outer membrane protein [Caulobacteraceae bacterium]|nr:OmpH family outer membrane protein [Caulobacteraceae bacterium]